MSGVGGGDVDPLGQVRANRHEHGVEGALAALRVEVLDRVVAGHPHPERREAIDLGADHVAWQPVGRDSVAHHPARLGAGVANLDLVSETGQMGGGGQPARPGADHQHPLATAHARRVKAPRLLQGQVAQEALDPVNRQRAVQIGAIADALARVVADPAVDRRERVVHGQHAPGLLVLAVLDVSHPALDVLPGRAARVARGE